MGKDETPAWGSPEFLKAIEEHDNQADPPRMAAGQKYTAKPAKEKNKPAKPTKGGKGKK